AHPADGIDLMAGPWEVREKLAPRAEGPPLRLRTYFPAELDAIDGLAAAYLDDSRRHIERYAKAIGPYPFDGFSVVASPLPTGFGMPTLTYIGAEVLKLPFIRATSLGHEVLHNWWGNGVFVDYASGNWAEGLTTFMADYAYKEDESAAAARAMRLGWLRDFAAVPAADQQPLAAFRSRTHGAAAAVGYGKSAMLFVMLREQIGADTFDRGIRAFWARHRFGVAGWSDLRSAFEAESGQDLATFFDQWLTRRGGPAPRIERARTQARAGGTQLIVDLAQSSPPYALKIPLELVYAGRRERIDVEFRDGRRQLTLDVDTAPASVRLDPELRLWRVLAPAQLPPILRQWITAATPRLAIAQAPGPSAAADETAAAAPALVQRLFERAAKPGSLEDLDRGSGPMLLIGSHAAVDAALAGAGLPPRPASLGVRGSAQVWTVIRAHGAPLAVVSARDVGALQALSRPLPHYGAQSWLVFEGSRVLERGVWEVRDDGVTVRQD
ncbi:MAG: peptidase M1, partial [Betaproteobacteria bacterium HGW-Betaproteobacteria-21]